MIPTDIYFLSYNIRNAEKKDGVSGYYEYEGRENKVRDYLVSSGADVIGLQEVSTLAEEQLWGLSVLKNSTIF